MTSQSQGITSSTKFRGALTAVVCVFLLGLLLNFSVVSRSAQQFTGTWTSSEPAAGLLNFDEVSFVQENFQSMYQLDPLLTRYVRARYLSPPSKRPYNFQKYPVVGHTTDISRYARNFFKNKRNGTFIEAGSNEGEFHSHTLDLEESLGWRGLLIECNPTVVPYLRTKERKAWVAGACISTSVYPQIVNFSNPEKWSYSGRIGPARDLPVATNWTYFNVEAVPLYNIIAAAGYKEIDFFSFDVEGSELKILKNFPFDRVRFNLMIVEIFLFTKAEKRELTALLKENGMSLHDSIDIDHVYVNDAYMEEQKIRSRSAA